MTVRVVFNGVIPACQTYIIDGQVEYSTRAIHKLAQIKGFLGSLGTIQKRLRSGVRTWAELCAPTRRSDGGANAAKARKKNRTRSISDCADAIAAIDARKAVMP